MPLATDLPKLADFQHSNVITYEPEGPFGAKEAGQGAGTSVLAALANAIYDATGVRLTSLPMTPEHIGLTHMHARYGLIGAIERFRKAYPAVQVIIRELKPTAIFEQVTSGEVDIGVANESPPPSSKLARLILHHSARNNLSRSVFVPRRHGLLKAGRITLEELARHPFIMLDSAVTGARLIGKAFADKALAPNIVMRATTADVIKAYVKLGLGVAVLPTITYDRRADQGLRTIDVTHLFGTTTITIALNPRGHLRRYMYEFISLIEPSCTQEKVEFQLRAAASGR